MVVLPIGKEQQNDKIGTYLRYSKYTGQFQYYNYFQQAQGFTDTVGGGKDFLDWNADQNVFQSHNENR